MANRTQQGFPLVAGRTPTPKRNGKAWGRSGEHAQKLLDRALDAVIVTRCGFCGVSVTRSARAGQRWFRKHCRTPEHKAKTGRSKD